MFEHNLLIVASQTGLAILLGVLGWYMAARLDVPAATILGPMLVIAAANLMGLPSANFPAWFQVGVQSIIGAYLGLKVDRGLVARTRRMAWPIALSTLWMIVSGLLIGYLVTRLTRIDLYTAMLGTTPGGIAEMTAMAVSVKADIALVATLQAFRLVTANVSIPFLARREVALAPASAHSEWEPALTIGPSPRRVHWLVCVLVGGAGGYFFNWLGIPAGSVLGAMLSVAVLQIAGLNFAPLPAPLRTGAQILMGIFIGATFNAQTLVELRASFVIVVATTIATVTSSLFLARFVQRWLNLDIQTALLACAPGGLTQMAIIADELGAQTFVVSLFQLTRVVCVVLFTPIIVRLLRG